MDTIVVNLETRQCPNCQKKFKVLTTSKSKFCGKLCEEYGTRARGAPPAGWRGIKPEAMRGSPNYEKPMKVSERKKEIKTGLGERPTEISVAPNESKPIEQTGRNSMQEELNGAEKTKSDNSPTNVKITISEGQKHLQESTQSEMKKTQRESSVASLQNIEMASLDILSLSKNSANRLMRLMEVSVSDTDFQKDADGVEKIPLHKIDTQVKLANAITQIVQSNINLLKAINK